LKQNVAPVSKHLAAQVKVIHGLTGENRSLVDSFGLFLNFTIDKVAGKSFIYTIQAITKPQW